MKNSGFKPRKTQMPRSTLQRTQKASDRSTEYVRVRRRRQGLKTSVGPRNLSEWSKMVRTLQDNICQRCGGQGTQAHHRAPRSRRPDLRLDLSNGLTTCNPCHLWIHSNPTEATAAGLLSDETYELAKKEAA